MLIYLINIYIYLLFIFLISYHKFINIVFILLYLFYFINLLFDILNSFFLLIVIKLLIFIHIGLGMIGLQLRQFGNEMEGFLLCGFLKNLEIGNG